jgi:transglutaminase-like putative cysteine protease
VKYLVTHVTTYGYAKPVDLASHMLHLRPRKLPHQAVLAARVSVSPEPARVVIRNDYFGNDVSWLFLDRPHDRFVVTLEAEVAVQFPPAPPSSETLAWESVAAAARVGGAEAWGAAEYVFDSPMVPAEAGAGAYAASSFPPGRPVLAGLLDLIGRIRRDFAFRPGATTIATPVARVLAQRAGVCQDFAHLMIAGLRAIGLPARYVSGYLRTRPPPGQSRRRGADASHAWVGCWLGPAHGWIDLDPTNDLVVSDEHVVLGWGRDFSDVSPVRGIILGGGGHSVAVAVDLDPL